VFEARSRKDKSLGLRNLPNSRSFDGQAQKWVGIFLYNKCVFAGAPAELSLGDKKVAKEDSGS
jgi:hypothetical protein